MTIEAQLSALTDAINNLTQVLSTPRILTAEQVTSPAAEAAKQEKPAGKSKKAETEKPVAASDAQPAATPATTEPTAASAGPALDYEKDVKPIFLKLVAAKGRDVARGLIDQYNKDAKTLREAIKDDQLGEVLSKIHGLIGG